MVHAHLKSLLPEMPAPESPASIGGSARPSVRFRRLCTLADINPKANFETGADEPWVLKDLRKTGATYYDERVPESSIEILGHSMAAVSPDYWTTMIGYYPSIDVYKVQLRAAMGVGHSPTDVFRMASREITPSNSGTLRLRDSAALGTDSDAPARIA